MVAHGLGGVGHRGPLVHYRSAVRHQLLEYDHRFFQAFCHSLGIPFVSISCDDHLPRTRKCGVRRHTSRLVYGIDRCDVSLSLELRLAVVEESNASEVRGAVQRCIDLVLSLQVAPLGMEHRASYISRAQICEPEDAVAVELGQSFSQNLRWELRQRQVAASRGGPDPVGK